MADMNQQTTGEAAEAVDRTEAAEAVDRTEAAEAVDRTEAMEEPEALMMRVLKGDFQAEGFEVTEYRDRWAMVAPVTLSSGNVAIHCRIDGASSQVTFSVHLVPHAAVPTALARVAADLLRVLNLYTALGAFTLDLEGTVTIESRLEIDEALIQPGIYRRTIRRLAVEADTFLPLIRVVLDDTRGEPKDADPDIDPFEATGFGLWDEVGVYPISWVLRYASDLLDD